MWVSNAESDSISSDRRVTRSRETEDRGERQRGGVPVAVRPPRTRPEADLQVVRRLHEGQFGVEAVGGVPSASSLDGQPTVRPLDHAPSPLPVAAVDGDVAIAQRDGQPPIVPGRIGGPHGEPRVGAGGAVAGYRYRLGGQSVGQP